jgi:hypothetical protein
MDEGRVIVRGVACVLSAACVLVACAGGEKPADSAGTCPAGTTLRGADCLPSATAQDTPAPAAKKMPSHDPDDQPAAVASSQGGPDASASPVSEVGTETGAYDKEAVESQLKRAARQIKANCGAATDEEGNKKGPWGTARASVVLGRNGHVRKVTLPPPYDGKPVGDCVAHAFEKLLFPPYAGSSDATVEWDVEIVQPKAH